MNKKIVGILVCMLFIGTVIPVVTSSYQDTNDRYDFDSDFGGYVGIINKDRLQDSNYMTLKQDIKGVPDFFNWMDFGGQDWTTPARDQTENCGSCWIFGVIGILESVINIREGSASIDPDLSEQYVLSCFPEAGKGCNGGNTFKALRYMMEETAIGNYHNGALLEECFPYQADDTIPCDNKCPDWVDKLVPILDCYEWWVNESPDPMLLIKSQILEKGGVSVSMRVTDHFFDWVWSHHDPNEYYPFYERDELNHIVDIVGWKDDPEINKGGYWIIKNSWGSDCGYDGFFNIEYGSLNIAGKYINWVDYDPESYEWPDEPNPPGAPDIDGPTGGLNQQPIDYNFKSIDPDDKDVRFYISWGDGDSEWTEYYGSNEEVTVDHIWNFDGTYTIMTLTMNSDNSISSWSTLDVVIGNQPPEMPYISGDTNGNIGEEYDYIFNAIDPEGDTVKYIVDWGDGNVDTSDFNPSNTDVSLSHIWDSKGDYTITAKAQDDHGQDGPENTLEVSMPKNKAIDTSFFLQRLIHRFPFFEKILNQIV